jgi:NMD protein affecting ribosome stability and mRNA decay
MQTAICVKCGCTFNRESTEGWRRLCVPCYKEKKNQERIATDRALLNRATKAESEVATWRDRAVNAELELGALHKELDKHLETIQILMKKPKPSGIDRELAENWRALMQHVHPDKHGGGQGATRLTQWLNGIKGKLPCA